MCEQKDEPNKHHIKRRNKTLGEEVMWLTLIYNQNYQTRSHDNVQQIRKFFLLQTCIYAVQLRLLNNIIYIEQYY